MEHTCTLKVRTYECDGFNHVNNAVYLHYLEYARMEFLYDIGFDYDAMKEQGYGIFIKRISIDYVSSAQTGDDLTIHSVPIQKRKTSGVFRQTIKNKDRVICQAEVTWVFVTSEGKPVKLPSQFDFHELAPEE